jgi:hypothetical protein
MRRVSMIGVFLATFASTAGGQVGYAPGDSPYREIEKGKAVTAVVGYFGGSGGSFGVGPHNGMTYGGRFDIKISNTIQLGFSISQGNLERNVRIPAIDTIPTQTFGPVPQNVLLLDIAAQLNLTGAKSWNRLAPYFAAVAGLAIAEETPVDLSRYNFGNKLYLAPTIGTRLIVSQTIQFRFEGRFTFWKLSYPTFFTIDNFAGQWLLSPWVSAGLSVAF